MKSKKDITYLLLAIIIALIGLSYAAVPLYQLFCQKTGFGGTVQRFEWTDSTKNGEPNGVVNQAYASRAKDSASSFEKSSNSSTIIKPTHPISPSDPNSKPQQNNLEPVPSDPHRFKIIFNADTTDSMPIIFKPLQKELYVHSGQPALAFYLAENQTDQVITGVSTYNITPLKFGSYFIKIQCFCFEEQRFNAGEIVELPVLFVVSPEIQAELTEHEPRIITLSYTFFRTNNQ